MASSSTTLIYGLVVRTWPLLVSSQAFLPISPLLKAWDLILLRQRMGTLKMEPLVMKKINFGNLPLEVLKIIRRKIFELISMEAAAESLIQAELRCEEYYDTDHDEDDAEEEEEEEEVREDRQRDRFCHTKISLGGDWSQLDVGSCESCEFKVFEFTIMKRFSESKLLEYYGLETESETTVKDGHQQNLNLHFSAIKISSSSPFKTLNNYLTGEYGEYINPAVFLNFSPIDSIKKIDVGDANGRLLAFMRDWRMELYDKKDESSDEEEGIEDSQRLRQTGNNQEIEPSWFLRGTAHADF